MSDNEIDVLKNRVTLLEKILISSYKDFDVLHKAMLDGPTEMDVIHCVSSKNKIILAIPDVIIRS